MYSQLHKFVNLHTLCQKHRSKSKKSVIKLYLSFVFVTLRCCILKQPRYTLSTLFGKPATSQSNPSGNKSKTTSKKNNFISHFGQLFATVYYYYYYYTRARILSSSAIKSFKVLLLKSISDCIKSNNQILHFDCVCATLHSSAFQHF